MKIIGIEYVEQVTGKKEIVNISCKGEEVSQEAWMSHLKVFLDMGVEANFVYDKPNKPYKLRPIQ